MKFVFVSVKFVFVIDIENNDYPVGFDKIALNFDIWVFRKKKQEFPAALIFWENESYSSYNVYENYWLFRFNPSLRLFFFLNILHCTLRRLQ